MKITNNVQVMKKIKKKKNQCQRRYSRLLNGKKLKLASKNLKRNLKKGKNDLYLLKV